MSEYHSLFNVGITFCTFHGGNYTDTLIELSAQDLVSKANV